MNIVNLPVLSNGKSYVCDFGGKTVGATVRGDEYFCKAPPLKDLPGFTADKGKVTFPKYLCWTTFDTNAMSYDAIC